MASARWGARLLRQLLGDSRQHDHEVRGEHGARMIGRFRARCEPDGAHAQRLRQALAGLECTVVAFDARVGPREALGGAGGVGDGLERVERAEARTGVGQRVEGEAIEETGEVEDHLTRADPAVAGQLRGNPADRVVRSGDEDEPGIPRVARPAGPAHQRDRDAPPPPTPGPDHRPCARGR